jgi:hypothetical protein
MCSNSDITTMIRLSMRGLFLLKYGFVLRFESIDQELLEMFAAKRDYVNRLSLYCRRFVILQDVTAMAVTKSV